MSADLRIPSRTFLIIAVSCIAALLLLAAGFVLGLMRTGPGAPPIGPVPGNAQITSVPQVYTCSMHPQIRLPDPDAKCPICFMDLIPVDQEMTGTTDASAPILTMSPAAMKLAEIGTAPVRRMLPSVEVRMVGKIDYDETRLATISAYIPGRLDRLYVDYTGIPVSKGDHLVSIYSPELFSAETELLTNLESFLELDAGASATTRTIAAATVQASREKLRLLGMTDEQVREIERTGDISDHMTIHATLGGVVTEKHKAEGEYVSTGDPIYSVADLTHLWVRLDAYESDLRWLRYGQDVEFVPEAYSDETFHGRVAFIDPEVSPVTRTVKLRVNVDNPDGRLKPGMFVRAVVRPVIAGEGRVVATDLAGRLVCPMHPEIVKDEQAPCDICGMDLLPAEQLGYVSAPNGADPPLVIPASAPLITGKRAVVYVRLPDRDRPTFEGRRIVLGPRVGDFYIVRENGPDGPGLAEGDEVVVNGNFKIDSALQIQARSSMMTPSEGAGSESRPALETIDVPHEFLLSLVPVFDEYLRMQEGLAADRLAVFQDAAGAMHEAIDAIDVSALDPTSAPVWADLAGRLHTDREHIAHLDDIAAARALFETFSIAMIELGRRFGYAGDEDVVITFCPMAFDDKGAEWLQINGDINNPYFGSEMLRCGEFRQAITDASPIVQPGPEESDDE